ncbi:hypothetical protein HanPSC8_Chr04g0140751 [Helianthus annuus]|nr:hypothetical protein HanPSC8_Chr04g0140751 [Helianthus annuus]
MIVRTGGRSCKLLRSSASKISFFFAISSILAGPTSITSTSYSLHIIFTISLSNFCTPSGLIPFA